MAGFSLIVIGFWLVIIVVASILGAICFVISLILLLTKSKKEKLSQKKSKVKLVIGIILMVISFGCQVPLGITVLGSAFGSHKMKAEQKAVWDAIENKVFVDSTWVNGFDYNGEHLIPVGIFTNSENYYLPDHNRHNLNQVGALVFSEDDYYNFYTIDNNSGYEIYYVWVSSFANGEYYSRTFVKEEDYDAVLNYYKQAEGYSASVLWGSAPEETSYANNWKSMDMYMDNRVDWLTALSHQVLDDVSDKKTVGVSSYRDIEGCDDYMEFRVKSKDGVFTLDMYVYTVGDAMTLYVDDYKVDDEITSQYKGQLLDMINAAKEELQSDFESGDTE